MGFNYRFAADELAKIYKELRQYEEFRGMATKILTIGDALRELAPPLSDYAGITPEEVWKPTPPKSDPNSKIPRPVPPPRGSGPTKVELPAGRPLGNSHEPFRTYR